MLLDPERADRIFHAVPKLREAGINTFLVFDAPGRSSRWEGIRAWDEAMLACGHDSEEILRQDPNIEPEDNATIFFTSGTYVAPSLLFTAH